METLPKPIPEHQTGTSRGKADNRMYIKEEILFIIMNSFKGKLYISDNPFNWPSGDMFAGLENYTEGISKTGFFAAFGWSAFITVGSVLVIVLFTSMTAWYLTRVKTRLSNTL